MNLQSFLEKRQQLKLSEVRYRNLCRNCMQPDYGCYCEHIRPVTSAIKWVILIHPMEWRRRIATGRMSHLCLKNSELIVGQNYSHDKKLNLLLNDKQFFPMVLYPLGNSKNLSNCTVEEIAQLWPKDKIPLLIAIDGTWATARKTMRLSKNLQNLPRVCFTPDRSSQFKVRKQPKAHFLSTIEAIHHSFDLLKSNLGESFSQQREHDRLLYVFDKMVLRQLDFIRESEQNLRTRSYPRKPVFYTP